MSETAFAELTQTATALDYDHRVTLLTLLAQSLRKEDLPPVHAKKRQFGSAKGKFIYPTDFDEDNEEIARLFGAV